ncbi:MAG: DUF5320 domain-containing protein [Desulfobacterales bacterium]
MPGFDRTGPLGRGAGTGRGLGPCRVNASGTGFVRTGGCAGFCRGKGAGRGFGPGPANQMMRADSLFADQDNLAGRGWFRRRNQIWAK